MKAGFAKTAVNPPVGMAMEGLGQPGGCEAIHDDLYARALWLSHEGQEALIIGCDLLFFEREVVDRWFGAIGRRVGLAPPQILLNVSHTHAGPRLTRWSYTGQADEQYLDQLEAALVHVAEEARSARQEVTLWAGMAETALPVSRRKIDGQGRAQWAPSQSGTTCNALPFCLFRNADGEVVSLVFSVSCHPSIIYDCIISAEYPGAAMRRLNAHFNTEGSLFLQGAGGDTKPRQIAVDEDHWRRGTWQDMEDAGAEVAAAVIARAEHEISQVEPSLRAAMAQAVLPLQPPPSRESFADIAASDGDSRKQAWAEDMLSQYDRQGRIPDAVEITVQLLELGPTLRLVGIEGELVGELGNAVIDHFGGGVTFALGYTAGAQIYVPSTRMLPEGGYEVDSYWEYHYPSPLAPGIEDRLIDAVQSLRRKVQANL